MIRYAIHINVISYVAFSHLGSIRQRENLDDGRDCGRGEQEPRIFWNTCKNINSWTCIVSVLQSNEGGHLRCWGWLSHSLIDCQTYLRKSEEEGEQQDLPEPPSHMPPSISFRKVSHIFGHFSKMSSKSVKPSNSSHSIPPLPFLSAESTKGSKIILQKQN